MVLPRLLLRLLLVLAAAVRRAGAQVGGALHPAPPRSALFRCAAAPCSGCAPALAAHLVWLGAAAPARAVRRPLSN